MMKWLLKKRTRRRRPIQGGNDQARAESHQVKSKLSDKHSSSSKTGPKAPRKTLDTTRRLERDQGAARGGLNHHFRNGCAAVETTGKSGKLEKCHHFLLYLTSATWTSGKQSEQLARELAVAMRAGVHVLLAHEMAGLGGQAGGTDAGWVGRCPPELLGMGHIRGAVPRAKNMGSGIYTDL